MKHLKAEAKVAADRGNNESLLVAEPVALNKQVVSAYGVALRDSTGALFYSVLVKLVPESDRNTRLPNPQPLIDVDNVSLGGVHSGRKFLTRYCSETLARGRSRLHTAHAVLGEI